MKIFIKNMIKVSLISLVLGIILISVGFNEYNPFVNIKKYMYVGSYEETINTGNSYYNTNKSLYGSEADYDSQKENSFSSEQYKGIDSINLQITIGAVTIQEGDSFLIKAYNIKKEEFSNDIQDGQWKITYNENYNNVNNSMNFFGVEVPLGLENYSNEDAPHFIITIPKDYKAKDLNINVNVGSFEANTLTADNLEIAMNTGSFKVDTLAAEKAHITIDTGSFNVRELNANEQSYFNVNTGNLIIDKINVKDITAECGVGELNISGRIIGNNVINNNIGDVKLNVIGNEADYNYKVDCGIGTVIINDNKYTGVSTQETNKDNADNSFTVDCGIGKVTLKIYE